MSDMRAESPRFSQEVNKPFSDIAKLAEYKTDAEIANVIRVDLTKLLIDGVIPIMESAKAGGFSVHFSLVMDQAGRLLPAINITKTF